MDFAKGWVLKTDEKFLPVVERKAGIDSPYRMSSSVHPGEPANKQGIFIRRGEDYSRIKRDGRRLATTFFTVLVAPSTMKHNRFGIVVGRRFGKAVIRNRAKRIFRELARLSSKAQISSAQDYVVFPRRACLTVNHETLVKTWMETLRKTGVISSSPPTSCEKFS